MKLDFSSIYRKPILALASATYKIRDLNNVRISKKVSSINQLVVATQNTVTKGF